GEVLGRRQMVIEADRVWQITDPTLDRERFAHRIAIQHADGAGAHVGQAQYHQDSGSLARAVRPEQAEELATVYRARDAVHGDGLAVALGQTTDIDDRVAHRRPNLATAPTRINSATAMMPAPTIPHMVEVETATRNCCDVDSPREEAVKVGA